jgi:hypothetical protein
LVGIRDGFRALPLTLWSAACITVALLACLTTRATGLVTGDCDVNGGVSIAEVQRCANLFIAPVSALPCSACDQNSNGTVAINEVQIVANCFANLQAEGCRQVTGVTPTPVATVTATPPVLTATPTSTPPLPTVTPTRTLQLPTFVQGEIDVDVFTADDGTTYYVLAVDLRPGSAGIGAQITSLALSSVSTTTFAEAFNPADPVLTAVATAARNTSPPLDRLWRTEVLTGLPTNDVTASDFDPVADNGQGRLFLPDGSAVMLDTEAVFPLTNRDGGPSCRAPCGALSRVIRQFDNRIDGDAIVFPDEFAGCVGGTRPCEVSEGANCGPPSFIPCDPGPASVFCSGGPCSNLGGEVPGQNVTLDDTVGSPFGASPGRGTENGFFLRSDMDLIVFIAEAEAAPQALRVGVAGFIVGGECDFGGVICSAAAEECFPGSCMQEPQFRRTLGTISGTG